MINTSIYKRIISSISITLQKNAKIFAIKLVVPITLLTLLNLFFSVLIPDIKSLSQDFSLQNTVLPFIFLAISFFINVSIAITTLRITILGENHVDKYALDILSFRTIKYLYYSFVLFCFISILSFVLFLIPYVGIYLIFLIIPIILSRISFIFPACAIDEKISFRESWNCTKRYKALTYFAVIAFPLIITSIISIPYNLSIGFLVNIFSTKFNILYTFLNILITVISITSLGSLYKLLHPLKIKQIKKKKTPIKRQITYYDKVNSHKVVIPEELNHKFENIKEELLKEYAKLNFNNIVYDRTNSWIIKNNHNEEAYVSLRYEEDSHNIIIQAYKTNKPKIKALSI